MRLAANDVYVAFSSVDFLLSCGRILRHILIETEMAITANHAVIGCAGYWWILVGVWVGMYILSSFLPVYLAMFCRFEKPKLLRLLYLSIKCSADLGIFVKS